MASLHKLLVQGVRSFGAGEKDAGSVQFQKPLTLIVGPNGTGKTTLIECLRYVTSGEIPPGNLSVFIHDVGVAKTSRVDAMVKLSVERANGAGRVDATRRMTAHRRGKKLTCKSDEATISRFKPDGSVAATLSSKVADTNREMCNLLGVSKAVLTNVIFCHQEQSNWPLGEPKKVKETFDEIFSAERYTKAVDVLRKLRTEKMSEMSTLQKELSLLKRWRDEKNALLSEQRSKEASIKEMEERLASIKQSLVPIETELRKVCGQLEASESDRAELKSKQQHRQFLSGEVARLKSELRSAPRVYDTLDEVNAELDAFKENNRDADQQIASMKNEQRTAELQRRGLESERGALTDQLAKLRYENKVNTQKRIERDKRLCDVVAEFKLNKRIEGEIDSGDVYEVLDMLNTERSTAEVQLAEAKTARAASTSRLHNQLTECGADVAAHERQAEERRELIDDQRRKIAELEGRLRGVADARTRVGRLEKEHAAAADMVERVEKEFNETETDASLTKLRTQRDHVDRKLRQLQETSRLAHVYNEKWSTVRNVRAQLDARKEQCDRLADKHRDTLNELLGYVPMGKVCASADECRQSALTAARRREQSAGELRTAAAQHDQAAKFARKALDAKRNDVALVQRRVAEATGTSPDLETALRAAADELEEARSDLSDHQGALVVYKKLEAEAKKRRCCPLCETSLQAVKDGEKLLEKLRARVASDLPGRVADARAKVASLEKRHERLLCLRPDADRLAAMKAEAKELQTALDVAMQKMKEARSLLEKAEGELSAARRKCERIDAIRPDLHLFDSTKDDLTRLENELEEAQAEMSLFLTGRSELNADWLKEEGAVDKLHKDLEQCQVERETIERKCQELSDSLNRHRNKLADLRDKRSSLHQELLSLRTQLQTHSATDALLKEARNELERLKSLASSSGDLLSPLKRKKMDLEEEIRSNSVKWDREVEKWAELMNKAASQLSALQQLQAQVETGSNLSITLENDENRLSQVEKGIQDAQNRVDEFKRLVDKLSRSAAQRQLAERQLLDNRTLVERAGELRSVQKDIDAANERLGSLNAQNVDELIDRKRQLNDKLNGLNAAQSETAGELRAVRAHLADVRDKLRGKNFANNDRELIEKHARHFVLNEACVDLQKYAKVLDMSIMKFHASKMEEINGILHDYWKVIYNGNDIDYVQIRSEAEEEKVSQKRRNYNYRVVMISNGVEMDMRARCSAGQKVLASILIRIALAEVFCDSCGILTLDEPTTNLDKEKVSALADALSRLVAERRRAGDLQLVVITHDAKFVAHMVRSCQPDVFYRLEKDENGRTKINCLDAMQSLDYLE